MQPVLCGEQECEHLTPIKMMITLQAGLISSADDVVAGHSTIKNVYNSLPLVLLWDLFFFFLSSGNKDKESYTAPTNLVVTQIQYPSIEVDVLCHDLAFVNQQTGHMSKHTFGLRAAQ